MKTKLIYATSNPGKAVEIGRMFRICDIETAAFTDFVQNVPDPEETGTSLGENAMIKARAYAEALSAHIKRVATTGQRFVVVADDTGLFIPVLNNEPGIKVRRWAGHKMGDDELITYALRRMSGLCGDDRAATFRTVLCVLPVDEQARLGQLVTFTGELNGFIAEQADEVRIPGFPFESLFEVAEYGRMLLGDLRHTDLEERMRKKMFNHRERAIQNALPYLRTMMTE